MRAVPSGLHPHVVRAQRAAPLPRVVVATEIVVGMGAVYGGYGLLKDAEKLGAKQAWLDGSIFPDYTVPGLFLLVVIGGGMLAAAAITLFHRQRAAFAARVMATVLVLWGVTETVTIGWRGWPQLVLVGAFVLAPALILARYSAGARGGPPSG